MKSGDIGVSGGRKRAEGRRCNGRFQAPKENTVGQMHPHQNLVRGENVGATFGCEFLDERIVDSRGHSRDDLALLQTPLGLGGDFVEIFVEVSQSPA